MDSVEINVKQEHLTAFSRIVSSMNVFPEVPEELPPLLDVLLEGELWMGLIFSRNQNEHRQLNQCSFVICFISDVSQLLEISPYEVPEGLCEKNSSHLDPELAGSSYKKTPHFKKKNHQKLTTC